MADDKKISELDPLPSALTTGDLLEVVRSGANYKAAKSDLPFDASGAADSAVSTHVGLADPHTQYALESALGNAATKDVGTSAGTVAAGNDSRLTDSRTPTTHATSHVTGGSDVIATAVAGGNAGLLSGSDKTKLDNTSGTNTGDQTNISGNAATVTTNANLTGDVTSVGNATTLAAGSAAALNSGTLAAARMPALTGDVTTAAGAVATTIATAAVTLAKMANLAQDQFIGRTTASTGVPETATITAAARTVLDDTTVGAMVDTLGGASSTGTGGIARATSPTFVTPALGAPASGVLTNCTGLPPAGQTTAGRTSTIGIVTDGGGSACTTGVKGYITVPFACTITGWSITADGASPTCTWDIWKIGSGTALPTVSNTIMGTKPALSTGNVKISTTLTSWTTSISADDIIGFNLDAIATATRISLEIFVTRN